MAALKRKLAIRLYRWLKHWAIDSESSSNATVSRYRAAGMRIGHNVHIYSSNLDEIHPELITIGDDVTITHAVVLTHDDAPVHFLRRRLAAPVTIGHRVFVGHHSLILPGVTIGDDSLVGAGAIVTRDVPPGSVVAGNPARVLCTIESYIKKMAADPRLLDIVAGATALTPNEARQATREIHRRYRSDLIADSSSDPSK